MNSHKISRRGLFRIATLGGMALWLEVIRRATEPVGFVNWFHWMANGQMARLGPPSRVALGQASSYDQDLVPILREMWEMAGAPTLRGLSVVLKPNLVDVYSGHPTFTDPRLTRAVLRLAREEMGARSVVVAEGTAFRRDIQSILDESGYTEMLAAEGVEFIDLNYDDLVEVPTTGGYMKRDSLLLPRTIAEAEVLVSIPKLKTHHWATISASLKNLFGVIPGIKYGWPKNTLHLIGIPASLAEIAHSLPVEHRVAVVDGINAMEGDGPLAGESVALGALVVGTDLLAVDATCARMMGMDPAAIDYMAFMGWSGLGQIETSRIQLVGQDLPRLQRHFTRPPGAS